MNRQHRHAATARTAGVAVVLALAGFLFTANAQIAGGAPREPQDLAGLVDAEMRQADSAAGEVATLRAEVDRLTDEAHTTAPGDTRAAERTAVAAGWSAQHGPGLEVKLWDAPAGKSRPDWVRPADLVVHQQDVQAVMNAMWAGGAEAMTVQGQRVVSTSAVRCVGNVLLLHGRTFSPPFVIQAIGDVEGMQDALADDPSVRTYRDYVEAVGLGWSLATLDDVQAPAYDGAAELTYATVPEDAAGAGARSATPTPEATPDPSAPGPAAGGSRH
jgi:uncharacterized protein YlxW (UPF0749 family)